MDNAVRLLLRGPRLGRLTDFTLAGMTDQDRSLLIVPSASARDRAFRSPHRSPATRILSWDDLWGEVATYSARPPRLLTKVASRAVLSEAIRRATRTDELGPLAGLIALPGIRNRLERQIRHWTLDESKPIDASDDRLTQAEYVIYQYYQSLCIRHQWVDEAGLAVWGSRILRDAPPRWFQDLDAVGISGPLVDCPWYWRTLEALSTQISSVTITETEHPTVGLDSLGDRLIELGFVAYRPAPDPSRPGGLVAIERELFSVQPMEIECEDHQGITIIGVPEGDMMARAVARQVVTQRQAGSSYEDILVIIPRDESLGQRIGETLTSWGIPSTSTIPKRLRSEPIIAVLRGAMRWPIDDYDTSTLINLWRNSLVCPEWPEMAQPDVLARAANAVRKTRVFRGREALRHELANRSQRDPTSKKALTLLTRFLDIFDRHILAGTWSEQSDLLRQLIHELGLDRDISIAGEPLERLFEAIKEDGDVFREHQGIDRVLTWAEFVDRVEAIIDQVEWTPSVDELDHVLIARMGDAVGASAQHIIIAGLGEGTFPQRTRLDPEDDAELIPREEHRFLDLVGSAVQSLCVIYPTQKTDGTKLLAAGFVDDLIRLLGDDTPSETHTKIGRVHPALIEDEFATLAQSAADIRVRSFGRALYLPINDRESECTRALKQLAKNPDHRIAFEGISITLALQEERTSRVGFGIHEGHLLNQALRETLRRELGPSQVFSASQLESYNLCPYQFFLKYVLHLPSRDERDEFETDRAALGTEIHRVLETAERELFAHRQGEANSPLQLDEIRIQTVLRASLDTRLPSMSRVVEGLRVIEGKRLERMLNAYIEQRENYHNKKNETSSAAAFEQKFGASEGISDIPALQIGMGEDQVLVQGSIDRIDLVSNDDGPGARIIDYKSGMAPKLKDVKTKLLVQLPIYAMAVENLSLIDGEAIAISDFGYWELKKTGYRSVNLGEWADVVERVENFILDQVARIRDGRFEVNPRVEKCDTICDFARVCRIRQVRGTKKVGKGLATLEWPT